MRPSVRAGGRLCCAVRAEGASQGALLMLQLRRLAYRIAQKRIVAGVHFPIDLVGARLLGEMLAEYGVRPQRAAQGSRAAEFVVPSDRKPLVEARGTEAWKDLPSSAGSSAGPRPRRRRCSRPSGQRRARNCASRLRSTAARTSSPGAAMSSVDWDPAAGCTASRCARIDPIDPYCCGPRTWVRPLRFAPQPRHPALR